MKILFNNLVLSATVTALTADANYPATNIQSPFLRKRFQSTNATDMLTITFSALTSINSIFYGYTNASTVTARLYNSGGLIITYTGISPSKFFADTSVTYVEIDLIASATAYMGGVGIGKSETLDPPESFWEETFDDRSIVSESQTGQVLQEYVEPLRIYNFNVPTITRDEVRAFQLVYLKYGRGALLWLDPITDALPVIYCRLTEPIATTKNKRIYTLKLTLKEAR